MKSLSTNIIASLFSLFLMATILLPSIVKISHAIHEHKEIECNAVGTLHLHEVELDCDFNTFNLVINFYPNLQSYNNYIDIIIRESNFNHYNFLSKYQKLHFSLRGPPTVS